MKIAGIVDVSEFKEGQGYDVKVDWVGFDEGKSSREPLAIIGNGAPQFIKSELRMSRGAFAFAEALMYNALT